MNEAQVFKGRSVNIDLVKTVAVCCVVSVHFFLNTGFYDTAVRGLLGPVATLARTALMVCVPLFLLTTGYLMKNKTLEPRYYLGALRTVVVYVLASLFCMLWRILCLGREYTALTFLRAMLDFTACSYAWYVEMYFGLFLLIPFLNIVYRELATREHRKALLVTLLFVVSLPLQINIKWQLLPEWWSDVLYPVLFYYLGSYLRDYPIKMKTSCLAAFFVFWVCVCGLFNYLISCLLGDGRFVRGGFNSWGSLENVVSSVLLFSLMLQLRLPTTESTLGKLLARTSLYSFAAYLLSWPIDSVIYPKLLELLGSFRAVFPYFPLVIPFIILCAFLLATIVTKVAELIELRLRSWTCRQFDLLKKDL